MKELFANRRDEGGFPNAFRPLVVGVSFLAVSILAGCGPRPRVVRYALEGLVTIAGEPVPVGSIRIEPDTSRGGYGPGAIADITNGRFKVPKHRGVVSGPHLVRIVAFEAPASPVTPGGDSPPLKPLGPEHVEQVDIDPKKPKLNIDLPDARRKAKER